MSKIILFTPDGKTKVYAKVVSWAFTDHGALIFRDQRAPEDKPVQIYTTLPYLIQQQ